MKTLKEKIKVLAEQQAEIKAQRKTVNFKGIRTLTPYQAFCKHLSNRMELRDLYAVLAYLKGRPIEQIDPFYKDVENMDWFKKLAAEYGTPLSASS